MKQYSFHHEAGIGGNRWTRREFLKTGAAAASEAPPIYAPGAPANSGGVGFCLLVVSDTHSKAPEDAPDTLVGEIDHVNQLHISLLNKLAGQPLPPVMSGSRVGAIKGVLHLGKPASLGAHEGGPEENTPWVNQWHVPLRTRL